MKIIVTCKPIDDDGKFVDDQQAVFAHEDHNIDLVARRAFMDAKAWCDDQIGEAIFSAFDITVEVAE